MNIYANARLIACYAKHQIGALGTHASKGDQNVLFARKRPLVFCHNALGNFSNLLGFPLMEGAVFDRRVDLLLG